MRVVRELAQLLLFPGFLFIFCYALFAQWVDRKAYARFQNRVGPRWFQPFADFVKLLAKEEIIPAGASRWPFFWMPAVGLAATATAFFYVPVWQTRAAYAFPGDLIAVVYLLSLPTLVLFLAGWYSKNAFAGLGATRAVTQLISYEVPFLLASLTPAIIAGSLSIGEIAAFTRANPWVIPCELIGLAVSILALQAKLERVPFDVPEAETEIVAGPLTEYTGRGLALFRLMHDVTMVAGAALIASLYLGGLPRNLFGFPVFCLKTLLIVVILAMIRAVAARLRIEQVVAFCWRRLVPAAIFQVLVAILIRGWWH
ncbi:MAG: complex I subunit 1 family protein [Bacteroidota bacterium]